LAGLGAELILSSRTLGSEELQCPAGKVQSEAEGRQGLGTGAGELLGSGRMRVSNPDLCFCMLEANSASFSIALSSSSRFKEEDRLCCMPRSLPFREETSQGKKCSSKLSVLLQVPPSTFCKPRVFLNCGTSTAQNTDFLKSVACQVFSEVKML